MDPGRLVACSPRSHSEHFPISQKMHSLLVSEERCFKITSVSSSRSGKGSKRQVLGPMGWIIEHWSENHQISMCEYLCTHMCSYPGLYPFRWLVVVLSPETPQLVDKAVPEKGWPTVSNSFLPMHRWKNQSQGSEMTFLRSRMVRCPQCQTASISRHTASTTTHCLLLQSEGVSAVL